MFWPYWHPAAVKLEKKPPLWVTRRSLITELEDKTALWISKQYSGSSDKYVYDDIRKNKGTYVDDNYGYLAVSPFWYFRMAERYDHWYNRKDTYDDINEKVRYDYYLALKTPDFCSYIEMSDEQIKKNVYEPRQQMWREAHRETLVELYGKISDDMVTEIISFC